LHGFARFVILIVNRAVSKKGKQRFKNTPRRLLLKKELEFGERKVALAEQEKALHLEAYTTEMVGLWRDADEATRERLAKLSTKRRENNCIPTLNRA
jgi:predicted transcriptional regulator